MEGNPFAPYKKSKQLDIEHKLARSLCRHKLKSLVKIKHTSNLRSQLKYFYLWSNLLRQTHFHISQCLCSLGHTLTNISSTVKLKHIENQHYAFYTLKRYTDGLVAEGALEAFLLAYFYRKIDKTNQRNRALAFKTKALNKKIKEHKETLSLIHQYKEENQKLEEKLAVIESNMNDFMVEMNAMIDSHNKSNI